MSESSSVRPTTVKAHVIVADLDFPSLDDAVAHHLLRVLRLRPGDIITATDGCGGWRPLRLADAAGGIEIGGGVEVIPRPSPLLSVAFAITKGDKPELVVQKLTELGIDRIVPFVSERSVVRWEPGKVVRNVERWRSVAREAVQQSRRVWVPEITDMAELGDLVEGGAARADFGGSRLAASTCRFVAVGPEGGWSDSERALLSSAVSLGDGVLRAETAAVVAGALLRARWRE